MKKVLFFILAAVIALLMLGCANDGVLSPDEATTTENTSADVSDSTYQTTVLETSTPPVTLPPPETLPPVTMPLTTLPPTTSSAPPTTTAQTTVPPPVTLPPATLPPSTLPPSTASSQTTSSTTVSGTSSGVKPQVIGGVMVLGDRAMEYYYGGNKGLAAYASSINKLKSHLPNVNVYALMAPTSMEFNCPPEYKKGTTSQKEAMAYWYSQMNADVRGVDTWTEMNEHRGEYLYFRTDTHWAQRGAYYAYRAFCYTAGFTPYELSAYEYGIVPGFLGYLYQHTKAAALKANPDSVEYFRPVNSSKMTIYQSSAMIGGYTAPVVSAPKANYYMFISGDNPISHIVSDVVKNGRKLIITKDSYGNALVPFLTDHFEEIFVIDQRYFNTSGKSSLKIVGFAQKHGITDFLVFASAFHAASANATFQRLLP